MGVFKQRNLGPGTIVLVALVASLVVGVSNFEAATGKETYDKLKLFSEVLSLVESSYVDEVDSGKLVQGAIRGMLKELDPHTAYMTEEMFNEMQVDTKGEFGGLGITIGLKTDVAHRDLADRGHAGLARRDQGRRPHPQGRRREHQGHERRKRRQEDARRAGDVDHDLDHARRVQGAERLHHRARRHQDQERQVPGHRQHGRLHPRHPVPGAHRRRPRAGAGRPVDAEPVAQGADPRSAQQPGGPARPGGAGFRVLPGERQARGLHQGAQGEQQRRVQGARQRRAHRVPDGGPREPRLGVGVRDRGGRRSRTGAAR